MSDTDAHNTHTLIVMPSDRRGKVKHGVMLLDAAQELGVEIECICEDRQTSEKCNVLVEEGHFDKHGITPEKSICHYAWRSRSNC